MIFKFKRKGKRAVRVGRMKCDTRGRYENDVNEVYSKI